MNVFRILLVFVDPWLLLLSIPASSMLEELFAFLNSLAGVFFYSLWDILNN